MPNRTALYIRVSSARQARTGASIPDQVSRLSYLAEEAGETIVGIFIDQARSGKSAANRPEYQRLLNAARQGEFDKVRIESLDRGHRNEVERRRFEDELKKLRVKVVYANEPDVVAPNQLKLQRAILGAVSESESDLGSQRTYNRHLHRAKQGKWRGGLIPYGLRSNGRGWFEPDPDTYPILCWILERRAEGLSPHSITKSLNRGISIDGTKLFVPPTPGLLQYYRKPYKVEQDPITGDEIHIPKAIPDGRWRQQTIAHICKEAVDGVYAGVLNWGRTSNEFEEDDGGLPKEEVRFDTGVPLIDEALLSRVQVVELGITPDHTAPSAKNTYLLTRLVRCGHCGGAMHGYCASKYKNLKSTGETAHYAYRKYRCAGRANKAGACTMTILSAERLEKAVLEAAFSETVRIAPAQLTKALSAAVKRRRHELLSALDVLAGQRREHELRRDEALEALLRNSSLSDVLQKAVAQRAEASVSELEKLVSNERTLRAGLNALDSQARNVERILTHPDLDPKRWKVPSVNQALQRALRLMVRRIEVSQQGPGRYTAKIWLPDAESILFSESDKSESAWESNPPAQLVTALTSFEDQDSHRATSALAEDCRGR